LKAVSEKAVTAEETKKTDKTGKTEKAPAPIFL
jgi:hypothetical protein